MKKLTQHISALDDARTWRRIIFLSAIIWLEGHVASDRTVVPRGFSLFLGGPQLYSRLFGCGSRRKVGWWRECVGRNAQSLL